MNKQEFIRAFSERSEINVSKEVGGTIVNAFLDTITEGLSSEGRVQFTGFGTFKVSERSGRMGRNPHTGEEIEIAPTNVTTFSAGKILKDAMNENAPKKKKTAKKTTKKVAKKKKK